MEERYRCDATLITTNLEYDQWHQLLGNKDLTDALLSRLRHQCQTIRINGPVSRDARSDGFAADGSVGFTNLYGRLCTEPIAERRGRISPALVRLARLISYLHESLTIFTSVTVRCPCSSPLFFMPLSFAASFASSFMLCIFAFETTPVAVTV
jgi:hypothetical protein